MGHNPFFFRETEIDFLHQNFKRHVMQIIRMKDLCKQLSISRSTAYNLIKQGKLKPIQIGPRAVGFEVKEVESYLRNSRVGLT